MSTTISGNLAELARTGPDRIAVLEWARSAAARFVSIRRNGSSLASPNYARVITSEGQVGHAYSEDAFRYFLTIEQKRLERSGCRFLLLLVNAKANDRPDEPLSQAVASRLFQALSVTLRDTDFTGWYRHGFVAGAVLTQLDAASASDFRRLIMKRVTQAIADGLPPSIGERLEVRVLESVAPEQS